MRKGATKHDAMSEPDDRAQGILGLADPLMTHIIMSGPIKPLTPAERAFAGMLLGRLQRNGETWVRAKIAAQMIGVPSDHLSNYAAVAAWRFTLETVRLENGRIKPRKFFAESDVKQTTKRLKQMRKRKE